MIVMFNLRRYLTLFCKQNVHTILSPSTNHHLHHYLSLSSRHQFFIIFNFLWSLLTTVSRWLVTLQRFTYISHNLPSQIEYRRHQRHETILGVWYVLLYINVFQSKWSYICNIEIFYNRKGVMKLSCIIWI